MKIIHFIEEFGLGGTERTAIFLAKEQILVGHEACILFFNSDGSLTRSAEVPCFKVNSLQDFSEFVMNYQPHILHWHRASNNLFPYVYETKKLGIRVIETNVFGLFTEINQEKQVDESVFVSHHTALRYMKKSKQRKMPVVIYNPVQLQQSVKRDLRTELGFSKDDFIILRYAREDYYKFGPILIDVVSCLHNDPNVKFVFIGVPKQYRGRLEQFNNCFILPTTTDDNEISQYLQMADVLMHSSLIGESFGYVYAESMLHNLPIITDYSLFFDNAQFEIIEHGCNGFIANSTNEYIRAINILKNNRLLTRLMGENGYEKANLLFDTKTIAKYYMDVYQGKHDIQANIKKYMHYKHRYSYFMNRLARNPRFLYKNLLYYYHKRNHALLKKIYSSISVFS